jgi:hypothetical protein
MMAKQPQGNAPTELAKPEPGLLEAIVRDNVLLNLGEPIGLHSVQVKCVWGDKYRVNVFVGGDVSSLRIAHTYFVQADPNGQILASTPSITRVYSA